MARADVRRAKAPGKGEFHESRFSPVRNLNPGSVLPQKNTLSLDDLLGR